MRIIAMIAAMTALTCALVLLSIDEWLPVTVLIASAANAVILRLLLARFAPHWSARRAVLVSAGSLALLFWTLAFAADLSGVIYRMLHPEVQMMLGFTIVVFQHCIASFVTGLIAALATGLALRKA